MEAIAAGIREMIDDDYISSRVRQVEYLGNKLIGYGIPIVLPIGGHGVFLDAKKFLPHIPQDQFPAQALSAQLYIDRLGIFFKQFFFGKIPRKKLIFYVVVSDPWNVEL